MCLSLCGLVFLGEGGCDLLRSGLSRSVPGPVLSLSLDHTAVGRRFSCTSSQRQLYVHPWCVILAFIMPSLVLWASGRLGRASPSDLEPRWTPVTPSGTRLFPWHHGDSLCKQSPLLLQYVSPPSPPGTFRAIWIPSRTYGGSKEPGSWPRRVCLDHLVLQHLSLFLPVPWCCMHVTCTLVSTQGTYGRCREILIRFSGSFLSDLTNLSLSFQTTVGKPGCACFWTPVFLTSLFFPLYFIRTRETEFSPLQIARECHYILGWVLSTTCFWQRQWFH